MQERACARAQEEEPHEGVQGGVPSAPGCLYNTMLFPLLWMPTAGWLWYQGESDAAQPAYYQKCFPAMISEWRQNWRQINPAMAPDTPFSFVQISSWSGGDTGIN